MTTASKNLTTKNLFARNLVSALLIGSALAAQGATYRLSTSSSGVPGNHRSDQAAVSADGRYVAFASRASNLVRNDRNNSKDVFVKDLISGQTTRVSVTSGGGESNGDSSSPSISADGRYVAFETAASNLVSGDNNGYGDVIVHDRQTGQTVRVSVDSSGREGNHASMLPAISGNGRHVAFQSMASNLVSGDSNVQGDIFVHDRDTQKTIRASVAWNTGQPSYHCYSPDISDDGRYVVFASVAPNLVAKSSFATDIFVKDMTTWKVQLANLTSDGHVAQEQSYLPAISGDGRYVAFHSMDDGLVPNDTNGESDIMIHEVSPHLSTSDRARIGRTISLTLESPRDAGKAYVALAATNNQFGIPLGARLFPLDNDWLLSLSLATPTVFAGFYGQLDQNGKASAEVILPALAGLLNFEFLVAYTTLDPTFPTGFRGFSNALPFMVGQ